MENDPDRTVWYRIAIVILIWIVAFMGLALKTQADRLEYCDALARFAG